MFTHVSNPHIFSFPFLYKGGDSCPLNHQTAILTHTLHKLASSRQWPLVFGILDKRPAIIDSFCPINDTTLIMKAAEQGSIHTLETLYSKGANLELKNIHQLDAFDYAVKHDEVFTIAKVIAWLKGNTHTLFKDPMFYKDSLIHPAVFLDS